MSDSSSGTKQDTANISATERTAAPATHGSLSPDACAVPAHGAALAELLPEHAAKRRAFLNAVKAGQVDTTGIMERVMAKNPKSKTSAGGSKKPTASIKDNTEGKTKMETAVTETEETTKTSGDDLTKAKAAEAKPEAKPETAGPAEGAAAEMQGQTPAEAKKTVSHALGEITWLMTQSAAHKHLLLSDLEWAVMPAILLEQFRIYYAPVPTRGGPGKAGAEGAKQPAACAIWARVSPEVEARLTQAGPRARLTLQDWRSGDKPYLIEVIAPFGGADKVKAEWEEVIGKGA